MDSKNNRTTINLFISIVVPAFNSEKTIGKCLDSLLAQDYPEDSYEIIVIDNNSTDSTLDIIEKYPVLKFSEKNYQSAYAARNVGIKVSKGEIIAFIDSDCEADTNWLTQGVKLFADKNIVGVGGKILSLDPVTWVERYEQRRSAHDSRTRMGSSRVAEKSAEISGGNAFFRKKIFDELGLFSTNRAIGLDSALCYAIQAKTGYKLVYASESIVYHKQAQTVKQLKYQNLSYGYHGFFVDIEFFSEKHDDLISRFRKKGFLRIYLQQTEFIKKILIITRDVILMMIKPSAENKNRFADNYLDFVRKRFYLKGRLNAVNDYVKSLNP